MKVFDLHNDLPTLSHSIEEVYHKREYTFFASNRAFLSTLQSAYQTFTNHSVVSVFWTTRLEKPLSYINRYLKKFPLQTNRLYAIEDLGFVETAEDLAEICALPLCYASLTWNQENSLAGGSYADTTLTSWGESVMDALNTSGIPIDTAHLNEKSFYAVLDKAEKILNSHTCMQSIHNHARNLSDTQIKHILSKGGIIGLTPVADFMGVENTKGTCSHFAIQIDTFVQKFSIEGLCIGTDFNGAEPLVDLNNYKEFENLYEALVKRGFKHSDIQRIFYTNAEKFFYPMRNSF